MTLLEQIEELRSKHVAAKSKAQGIMGAAYAALTVGLDGVAVLVDITDCQITAEFRLRREYQVRAWVREGETVMADVSIVDGDHKHVLRSMEITHCPNTGIDELLLAVAQVEAKV